ncbi:LysE family transporter [Halorussus gelatinilyticus]|uniref:LysE family transporter n=1 Tax=Halorussus gelatinilyticus TaxID=2937524 RepID=A0A8U0IEQ2_9EURY|nr:LysE family transporter [Halorussus gelatinilyticus]UPV99387.1 LysE family transporter [Halorussus gelatinilyticus]
MFDVVVSALAGVALGLSLAAPPGPMNAIIAEESVLRGWGSGFRAGLGAMSADACFFVLALLGVVTVVRDVPVVQRALFGFGGLLMLYFAYGTATDANEAFGGDAGNGADDSTASGEGIETATDGPPEGEDSKGFRKAFVLALTNPYQILWWLTAGVGLLDPGTFALDWLGGLTVSTGSPVIVVGFFAGIALWISGFPAALVTVGRRVDAFAPVVAYLSAVVLALAGLSFLSKATGFLA